MSEFEIRQVMLELGLDYIQARNHLKCRSMLRDCARIVRAPLTPFLTELARADVNAKSSGSSRPTE